MTAPAVAPGCRCCGHACPGLYCDACRLPEAGGDASCAACRGFQRVAAAPDAPLAGSEAPGKGAAPPQGRSGRTRAPGATAGGSEAEEPALLVFAVPLPPNFTNDAAREHWSRLNAARDAYKRGLDSQRAAGHLPAVPDVPHQRVRLTSVMYVGGAMDDDNAMARHKWLIDWLVGAGYLAGDRKKHIAWSGMPTQVVQRTAARIVLLMEPLDTLTTTTTTRDA